MFTSSENEIIDLKNQNYEKEIECKVLHNIVDRHMKRKSEPTISQLDVKIPRLDIKTEP